VIERRIGIGDLLSGGVELDAKASASLIQSIFWPNSPLHDLALVVRGGRLAAAGVQLPLADGAELPSLFGARHRAALGVSEESDALVVVVSEETAKTYTKRLLKTLDVNNRLQAVLKGMRCGMVQI
jgi:diadenylate cyclase